MGCDQSTRERVLDIATRLFAELGYDETSLGLVADAVGLSVAEIDEEFGGKRGLYLNVYRHLHEQELDVVDALGEVADHDSMHRFVDVYLAHLKARPERAALWLQRRLHDAADIREVERTYLSPQVERAVKAAENLFRPGIDPELALWTVAWTAQAYTLASVPGEPADAEETHERILAHLHRFADLLMERREEGHGHGASAP
ncbi:TetR/AcrR family transcriptional regulator [Actinocorallia sp. API 0066]|uniref:TetR/AcrR family transcriptional regulator n=1 Tax=Actinocorallia sp. API 0066 TaxID=2896846 RepID=UPI001E45F17B|nr:TetR/AcrR family transcriptional regulator [Actinocorallia sp. API 0066]MCD0449631.1 TetR/AcrR family transcriptional regulator [Actinocorallia sp. API 0066]